MNSDGLSDPKDAHLVIASSNYVTPQVTLHHKHCLYLLVYPIEYFSQVLIWIYELFPYKFQNHTRLRCLSRMKRLDRQNMLDGLKGGVMKAKKEGVNEKLVLFSFDCASSLSKRSTTVPTGHEPPIPLF